MLFRSVRSMYLDGYGLFHECRYTFVAEAILNLFLNFVLGNLFGVTGIIVATLFTIVILNFITRTNILFKYYFKRSPKKFYLQHLFYFFVTIVAAVLTYSICNIVSIKGIAGLLIRLSLCVFVPNLILLLFYFRYSQFKASYAFINRIILKH